MDRPESQLEEYYIQSPTTTQSTESTPKLTTKTKASTKKSNAVTREHGKPGNRASGERERVFRGASPSPAFNRSTVQRGRASSLSPEKDAAKSLKRSASVPPKKQAFQKTETAYQQTPKKTTTPTPSKKGGPAATKKSKKRLTQKIPPSDEFFQTLQRMNKYLSAMQMPDLRYIEESFPKLQTSIQLDKIEKKISTNLPKKAQAPLPFISSAQSPSKGGSLKYQFPQLPANELVMPLTVSPPPIPAPIGDHHFPKIQNFFEQPTRSANADFQPRFHNPKPELENVNLDSIKKKIKKLMKLIEDEGSYHILKSQEFQSLDDQGKSKLKIMDQKYLILLDEVLEELDVGDSQQSSFFLTEIPTNEEDSAAENPRFHESLNFQQESAAITGFQPRGGKKNKIDAAPLEKAIDYFEKREQEFREKEREFFEKEVLFQKSVEDLKNQNVALQQTLNAQLAEMQMIHKYKDYMSELQSKLDKREREMEEQDMAFEQEMQEHDFDRKHYQDKLAALADREFSLAGQETEFKTREIALKKKEEESAAMLIHLTNVLEAQQKRDKQAQDELKKGFLVLKEKYDKILEKERQLNDFKSQIDQKAVLQRRAVEELNAARERLVRQSKEISERERRLDETISEKRKALMTVESALFNKQRDLKTLQDRENKVVGLIHRLGERERDFGDREKRFMEVMRGKKQDMQKLDELLDSKRSELSRIQQKVMDGRKELETLENSEIFSITSSVEAIPQHRPSVYFRSPSPGPPEFSAPNQSGSGMLSPTSSVMSFYSSPAGPPPPPMAMMAPSPYPGQHFFPVIVQSPPPPPPQQQAVNPIISSPPPPIPLPPPPQSMGFFPPVMDHFHSQYQQQKHNPTGSRFPPT